MEIAALVKHTEPAMICVDMALDRRASGCDMPAKRHTRTMIPPSIDRSKNSLRFIPDLSATAHQRSAMFACPRADKLLLWGFFPKTRRL